MNTRAVACGEMCRTSAHFMLIGTEHHRHTCRECAEICRQCADHCERVGDMEIRGAPRDALVADIAPPELRGASFGLRQSLDMIGAFFGPLVAIGLMWLTADHFQTVFWIAVLPAFLSVGVLLFLVREPERPQELRRVRTPLHRNELRRLGKSYWWVVAVAAVFTLARLSEAFLILKAQSIGMPITPGGMPASCCWKRNCP